MRHAFSHLAYVFSFYFSSSTEQGSLSSFVVKLLFKSLKAEEKLAFSPQMREIGGEVGY